MSAALETILSFFLQLVSANPALQVRPNTLRRAADRPLRGGPTLLLALRRGPTRALNDKAPTKSGGDGTERDVLLFATVRQKEVRLQNKGDPGGAAGR